MSRLRRRLVLIAMWLCIALLPLRGWANVVMQAAPAFGPGQAHLQVAPHASAAPRAMRCHGSPAQEHAGTADHKPCVACDICHGVALTSGSTNPGAGSSLPPRVAHGGTADAGAQPKPLFRPPRA